MKNILILRFQGFHHPEESNNEYRDQVACYDHETIVLGRGYVVAEGYEQEQKTEIGINDSADLRSVEVSGNEQYEGGYMDWWAEPQVRSRGLNEHVPYHKGGVLLCDGNLCDGRKKKADEKQY